MQLNRADVPCHIIQVGSDMFSSNPLGFLPDTETMKYVASKTGGFHFYRKQVEIYSNSPKESKKEGVSISPIQRALLFLVFFFNCVFKKVINCFQH